MGLELAHTIVASRDPAASPFTGDADTGSAEKVQRGISSNHGENHVVGDPLNFPIKLNNKLAALDASIGRGDGKPTAGSHEVFKVLSDLLAVQKARLDAALKTDVYDAQ